MDEDRREGYASAGGWQPEIVPSTTAQACPPSAQAPYWGAEPVAGPPFASPYAPGASWAPPLAPQYPVTLSAPAVGPRRRGKPLKGALIVIGATLGAICAFAVAIPTFLAVQASTTGKSWFSGGVPGWPTISVRGLPTDGSLKHAWATPGPSYGPGDGPFLALIQINTPADWTSSRSTQEWLSATEQRLTAQGVGQATMVQLSDGSPALQWTRPDHPVGEPSVDITDFVLFAQDGAGLFMVYFSAPSQDFSSDLVKVQPVMFSFKGTANKSAVPNNVQHKAEGVA